MAQLCTSLAKCVNVGDDLLAVWCKVKEAVRGVGDGFHSCFEPIGYQTVGEALTRLDWHYSVNSAVQDEHWRKMPDWHVQRGERVVATYAASPC